MDDEFVDTSDFPDPVISHCDPQHPTVVSSTQPADLVNWTVFDAKSYRNDLTTPLYSPGTSISATVPWLKRVED